MKWGPHLLLLAGLILCGIAAAGGTINGLTLVGFIVFGIGGLWFLLRPDPPTAPTAPKGDGVHSINGRGPLPTNVPNGSVAHTYPDGTWIVTFPPERVPR